MTVFLILLRYAEHRDRASQQMAGHEAWIQRGFDEGAFLLVGSLRPGLGGVVLARASSRAELEARVAQDPFVAARVVSAELLEVAVARATAQLDAVF